MYYICTLRVFKNFSFLNSLSKYPFKVIINQPKTLFSTAPIPVRSIRNLSEDVLLYTFEKVKFYRFLSIFAIVQFSAWSFYGGLMYMSKMDVANNEDLKKYEFLIKGPIWKKAMGGSSDLFYVMVLFITLGLLGSVACIVLPSRVVKELTLCKGGKAVILMTYGPFGNIQKCEIPLGNLHCVTPRSQAKTYVTIRIKPKWLYYFIDIRGNFHDPKLFDYTIGTKAFRAY